MFSRTVIVSFLKRLLKPRRSQRPPPGPVYPLGLSQDQVDSLRVLVSTPQWRSYTEALTAVCEQSMAQVLSGLPHDLYLVQCGRTQAILEALSLPETIDQKASVLDEHNRSARPADPGKRNLTFFGSPWFSPSQRPNLHGPVDGSGNGTGMGAG